MEFLLAKKTHFGISKRFTPLRDEGKPRPYNISVFWFGAIEIPVRFPPQLSACADVIHQESPAVGYPPYVTNTFHDPIWDEGKPRPYGVDADGRLHYAAPLDSFLKKVTLFFLVVFCVFIFCCY
ncbi:MAG: hypothetical protein LBQ66_11175 [Planctomycetaceae bacterium]|nr:hypothetical protein [Planctomycetaceae bacterium]